MARSFGTCLQLPLSDEVLLDVIGKAKDWAMMNGAAMRPRNAVNSSALQVGLDFLLGKTSFASNVPSPNREFAPLFPISTAADTFFSQKIEQFLLIFV